MGILRTGHRDPDAFPAMQLFLLAIVRLAEPIALTSIFPYAWALVKSFEIGREEDASFYSGILISAFSLAEAVMGTYWGGLSDRIGRKPVLIIGSLGTMLSMLIVGVAPSFGVALFGRLLGGLLNGNIGVIQTMVGELVTKPEHEPRAYSIMPFVWSIGTIVGPSIGGMFANPQDSWPESFPAGSLFQRHPYLLPNVICAALLLVSIVLGFFLLEETHPDMIQKISTSECHISEETPLMNSNRMATEIEPQAYGAIETTENSNESSIGVWDALCIENEKIAAAPTKTWNRRVVGFIVALSIFTYHSMTFDHLLPIFFEDNRVDAVEMLKHGSIFPFYSPGGLGMTPRDVGVILAVDGGIALFIQIFVFPWTVKMLGTYRLFLLVTVFHPVIYILMPMLLLVPESSIYPAIYGCLVVRNILSIILYPLLMILIKEATPTPSALGRVNGLAASAGAACRMIASPIAGFLWTVGTKSDCSALAWFGSAIVAILGAIQCFSVPRRRNEEPYGEDSKAHSKQTATVTETEFYDSA
ncbi:tetracycline resistance TCR1 [Fusarium beomiforme]|uniref:Tetracycline resistance TCR1 n=1 Tax=Fusarium beomiforme TaxID=44412 RepID=A0A9P5AQ76_9HYPO|nr:tetracycline resistance TCR1 [Fusarium beomiforme]